MQLTYDRTMAAGFPGMKSSAVDDTVETGINEESSAEIPFGVGVAQGTAQDAVKLPAAGNSLIVGVSVHDAASFIGPNGGVPSKRPVNVMAKGRVYVLVEDAVTPTSPVFVRHAANGGNTVLGRFRGTTATGATQQLFGCRFRTSAGAGGLVELEVDFTTVKATVDLGATLA